GAHAVVAEALPHLGEEQRGQAARMAEEAGGRAGPRMVGERVGEWAGAGGGHGGRGYCVHGPWSMVFRPWSAVHGLDYGLWTRSFRHVDHSQPASVVLAACDLDANALAVLAPRRGQ